jgi:hypothetical protein
VYSWWGRNMVNGPEKYRSQARRHRHEKPDLWKILEIRRNKRKEKRREIKKCFIFCLSK